MIFAGAGQGFAQATAQAAPPQSPPAQTQAPPAQTQAPPAVQPPSGELDKPAEQPPRPSKRTPRTPRRQPSQSSQGSFEQGRTSRDGGPTRQEVTLTANVLGGYDDNVTAGLGSGAATAPDAMVSGPTASLDGTLGYFRGNSLRSFQLDTTGSLTGYPGNLDSPAPGAVADVRARTPIARDWTLGLSERVGYESLFNVYSSGASGTPLPPGVAQPSPTTGLFERKSWSSNSAVSLDRRWSRQDTTTLAYSYRRQQFIDDDYGDNSWQDVTGGYRRILSPRVKAGADYRYVNGEYADSNQDIRPTREHRIEGVAEFTGAPSRRRHFTLSLAAGAGYLASIDASGAAFASWLPIGRGSLMVDVSPSWFVEGGYQRDVRLLQGVTDDIYSTGTGYLTTGGLVGGRTSLRIGATYSNWVTPVASGVDDTMNVYGATLGFRFRLTGSLAATAAYYYYFHRYSNPAALPEGFPAEYDRQAVRVGLTVFVPLAGAASPPQLNRR